MTSSPPLQLNLSTWVSSTSSEGPGKRFALWVQGCTIRCPGCCNPDMFSAQSKQLHSVEEVFSWIEKAQERHSIEGVTFLGGEPFEQAEALADLAEKIKTRALSLMVFSGYLLEHIQQSTHLVGWQQLLQRCDILVDGPYLEQQRTSTRRWIGSENQRIHFFSSRYSPQDPCWQEPNTFELFFDGKELQISGFPEGHWVQEIQKLKKEFLLKKP
ncbi:MAG: 4Fe-4S single cluster domain-containing protein [Planctomycetota bacterium]